MKKRFIVIILLSITLLSSLLSSASLSSTEITEMVAKIKKERVGISLAKLESTANPFIIRLPKPEEVEEEVLAEILPTAPVQVVYHLKAILNKAAFIDKKWYKQGDTIGNYKVGYISSHSVELKNGTENRILSLEKKKKKFIKLNRGYR